MLLPLFGSLVFIVLYIVAASFYPGGSQEDRHVKGFSWLHNYWCNLLNEKAMNGEANEGRWIAIIAMIVLLLSLLSFWILASEILTLPKSRKRIIQAAGLLSVTVLPFLSSSWHDTVINLAGFFGLVAMIGTYTGIYANAWYGLFSFGIFNLILIAVNNYLYYMEGRLYYLPLVQKITFLSCLIWICWVDIKLYELLPATTSHRNSKLQAGLHQQD